MQGNNRVTLCNILNSLFHTKHYFIPSFPFYYEKIILKNKIFYEKFWPSKLEELVNAHLLTSRVHSEHDIFLFHPLSCYPSIPLSNNVDFWTHFRVSCRHRYSSLLHIPPPRSAIRVQYLFTGFFFGVDTVSWNVYNYITTMIVTIWNISKISKSLILILANSSSIFL